MKSFCYSSFFFVNVRFLIKVRVFTIIMSVFGIATRDFL